MYKLCEPAMVYVVLAGISILFALFSKFHAFSILTKIVFVGAWTWFLNYLCMKGYKAISWFLVLLPFLIMLGIFALAAEIVNVASKQVLPGIMVPGITHVEALTTKQASGNSKCRGVACRLEPY